MKTDPERALDLITSMAKERYETDPSQSAPIVFVFKQSVVATIVTLDFDNDAAKHHSINEARRIVKTTQADAAVFISEGWMVSKKHDEIDMSVPPSQSRDRVEVLMIEASASNYDTTVCYEISRNPTGKFMGLDNPQRHDGSAATTKFNFFQ